MARVRTREEVEEIKIREKIKLSLVSQQRNLNTLIARAGCPTARGKVYITSIFQKNGQLSITRPQLCLRCAIRAHLNMKDVKNRRAPRFDPKLDEPQIHRYCVTQNWRTECAAYRRLYDETDNILVRRELTP